MIAPIHTDSDQKRKFLNIRVGAEFFEVLMSTQIFKDNWKAVSPAFYLIQRIATLNAMKGGNPVAFSSEEISKIFKPYTNAYAPFIDDLEALGLLVINHSYRATRNKTGECMKYLVTEKSLQLINSGNMEYLRALKDDRVTRRRNQKSISSRKVMHLIHTDPVLDYVYDGLKHLGFDLPRVARTLSQSNWSNYQKVGVTSILTVIAEKDFERLTVNSKDGRVHHEEVRLKSDARHLLKYKDMPYRATVDIRCCHPSFFSAHIRSSITKTDNNSKTPNNNNNSSPSLPIPPLSSLSLHYVTHNRDILTELDAEHQKWIELFCDPKVDPKEVIQKACRFKTPETTKSALNESLNGSTRYPKFLDWMKAQFPTLFQLWQETEVKQTGNAISKQFERRLILNHQLYEFADDLGGIKVIPEHDGLGVFSNDKEDQLQGKLDKLADHLRSISDNMFEIPVVAKTKLVYDWSDADLHTLMKHQWDRLSKEYDKVVGEVNRAQRRKFARNSPADSESQHQSALQREYQLLARNRSVIGYWSEGENASESEAPEI